MMLFNIDKCKVMHFEKNSSEATYQLGGRNLESVHEEKDLGVIIQDNLKISKRCSKAVNSANRILGMISRTFVYKEKEVILQLYKSFVRPHIEYCIQAWRPHLEKDKV